MAKKVKSEEEKDIKVKPKKKKLTANQKRKIVMKIVGWIMALVMIVGSLISMFGLLIYR